MFLFWEFAKRGGNWNFKTASVGSRLFAYRGLNVVSKSAISILYCNKLQCLQIYLESCSFKLMQYSGLMVAVENT